MFIFDYEKVLFEKYKKDFLSKNESDLENLKKFFIVGQLYNLHTTVPVYTSIQKLNDKKWEWLTQSYDVNNNPIPMMFIEIMDRHYFQIPIITIQRALSKAICIHFLKGSTSIYIPLTPGSERNIFEKYE